MPRKNCNARPVDKPKESWISLLPYDGRIKVRRERDREIGRNYTTIKTTPESIVREFRVAGRVARVEVPVSEKPISTFEKAVRIFLILAAGWLFGYFHCWMVFK